MRHQPNEEAAIEAAAEAIAVYSEAAPSVLAKAAIEAALPYLLPGNERSVKVVRPPPMSDDS